MENNCGLVSSRGILKSCTVRADYPVSSCDTGIEYLENMQQHDNMSIYVCSHLLRNFVKRYLPRIKHRFYLVSGDSDLAVPNEALNDEQFQTLLANEYLVTWFAQNLFAPPSSNLRHLPIGLDYHTISENPNHWWRMHTEGHLPCEQETILRRLRKTALPFHNRPVKIFSNVHFSPDRYGQRQDASNTIPKDLLVRAENHLSRTQTWERKCQYAFVLSPYGNGYDCHRTWEALCLGAIPIMKADHFSELFEDLPVLNVKDWSDITQELLDKTVEEFKDRPFQYEKLSLVYWTTKFSRNSSRPSSPSRDP